jgi:hypothetical protein
VVVTMRAYLSLLALVSLSTSACGGADEGRPPDARTQRSGGEGGAGFDECEAAEQYEFKALVDFEPYQVANGTAEFARCDPDASPAGISCSFYFNYDEASSPKNTAAGLEVGADCEELLVDEDAEVFTFPRIGQQSFMGQTIEGGRCGEEGRGLNIVTQNVGQCIGSDGRRGWGAALDVTFMPPLDASDWDGLSLWAKQGATDSESLDAFIIQFVDPNTSGAEDPNTLEPTCDASDPAVGQQPVPDTEKCDSFGTAVTLSDDWALVPASFADLQQRGFGVASPLGHLKTDEINRIQIFVNAGDADFWLDDISLFRKVDK